MSGAFGKRPRPEPAALMAALKETRSGATLLSSMRSNNASACHVIRFLCQHHNWKLPRPSLSFLFAVTKPYNTACQTVLANSQHHC